jgi:DNA gyrase subunit B
LGGVRAKPSSIGLENHQHSFIEILANAIDENREGYGDRIIVTKHIDNSITIQDFGRSVPMDKNTNGEYAYKKVFDELWSGGKYKNNKKDGNYLYSLGTNGCGATGTNYISDFFECTAINKNGIQYYIRYEKGIQQGKLEKTTHNLNYTGTIIHWLPSKEVFRGENNINSNFIEKILKQQSIVNAGLKFEFNNEITKNTLVYYYENGIIDYIKEINNNKNFTNIIQFKTETIGKDNNESDEYKIRAKITFCFNNEVNLIEYYHNSSYLENGGTPELYIKNSLVFAIDKYLKDNNMYSKQDKKINFNDIEDSLIIISDTYSTISLYSDQIKKKIESKFMQEYITTWLKHQLEVYFTENKLEADKIANQVLINARANNKANQTKLNIKKKLQINSGNKLSLSQKIEGVKHCDMRNSKLEERYFLVDEGLSANSTISDAIDSRIMGCCGLRGRFINSLKSSISDVLENEPALKIIQALGCGIEIPFNERKKYKNIDSFDINNLKYAHVGILCDADAFGKGINLSLITFFYKFFPTLLKQNRIYLVKSPRFEIVTKDRTIFVYNETEKQKIINGLKLKNKSYHIGIKKGLGEFNKEDFYKYVLSDEARKHTFIPIEYEGAEDMIKYYFNMLMGDDIKNRKQFIKDNIVNLNLNEIE